MDKGYCHSDLKPDNITLSPIEGKKDCYEARIIDFGSLTYNTLEYKAFTPFYFYHPLRQY